MDLAPGRGATREHIPQRSVTEEQRRPGAKDTQPDWVRAEKGPQRRSSSLTDPLRDMLGRRASLAPSFCSNDDTHSFFNGLLTIVSGRAAATRVNLKRSALGALPDWLD